MMIETILFDAAGTLIKTAQTVGESYAVIAAKYGMRVPPAQLAPRFRACFEDSAPLAFPEAAAANITALEQAWWKRVVRQVFLPFGEFEDFDACFEELFAYFARADSWVLYPDVPGTLAALSERGVKLAVVSNFDSRLITIMHGLGLADWFDGIFVSSAVGYAKPDRRIFDFVLKTRRLAPANVLHVGDSITNDVEGAANAGIKGILVDRKRANQAAPMTQLANLKEIVEYLD
jgi:putative hydrolase of the HAD superfamily